MILLRGEFNMANRDAVVCDEDPDTISVRMPGGQIVRKRRKMKRVVTVKPKSAALVTAKSKLDQAKKNASFNSSIVKQSLRTNNRQLARALETVRRQLTACQQENLQLQEQNQCLVSRLSILRRVSEMTTDDVEKEVQTRVNEQMRNIQHVLTTMSDHLMSTVDSFGDVMKLCSNYCRGSSLGASSARSSVSSANNTPEETTVNRKRRSIYCMSASPAKTLQTRQAPIKPQPDGLSSEHMDELVAAAQVDMATDGVPSTGANHDLSVIMEQSIIAEPDFTEDSKEGLVERRSRSRSNRRSARLLDMEELKEFQTEVEEKEEAVKDGKMKASTRRSDSKHTRRGTITIPAQASDAECEAEPNNIVGSLGTRVSDGISDVEVAVPSDDVASSSEAEIKSSPEVRKSRSRSRKQRVISESDSDSGRDVQMPVMSKRLSDETQEDPETDVNPTHVRRRTSSKTRSLSLKRTSRSKSRPPENSESEKSGEENIDVKQDEQVEKSQKESIFKQPDIPKKPPRRGTFVLEAPAVESPRTKGRRRGTYFVTQADKPQSSVGNVSTAAERRGTYQVTVPLNPHLDVENIMDENDDILVEEDDPIPAMQSDRTSTAFSVDESIYLEQDMDFTEVLPVHISAIGSQQPPVQCEDGDAENEEPSFFKNIKQSPVRSLLPPEESSDEKQQEPSELNDSTTEFKHPLKKVSSASKLPRPPVSQRGLAPPIKLGEEKKFKKDKSSTKHAHKEDNQEEEKNHSNFRAWLSKPGKITFTAGRKDAEVDEAPRKSRSKQKSTLPKVKQRSKSRSKQRPLPDVSPKSVFDFSGTPRGNLPKDSSSKAKSVFELSLNESITLPTSSYSEFKDRHKPEAERQKNKKPNHSKEPPKDNGSTEGLEIAGSVVSSSDSELETVTGESHGIMLVLGNGRRTKPRSKSKQVSYSAQIAEVHATTPQATPPRELIPETPSSIRKLTRAGTTPPRPPPDLIAPESPAASLDMSPQPCSSNPEPLPNKALMKEELLDNENVRLVGTGPSAARNHGKLTAEELQHLFDDDEDQDPSAATKKKNKARRKEERRKKMLKANQEMKAPAEGEDEAQLEDKVTSEPLRDEAGTPVDSDITEPLSVPEVTTKTEAEDMKDSVESTAHDEELELEYKPRISKVIDKQNADETKDGEGRLSLKSRKAPPHLNSPSTKDIKKRKCKPEDLRDIDSDIEFCDSPLGQKVKESHVKHKEKKRTLDKKSYTPDRKKDKKSSKIRSVEGSESEDMNLAEGDPEVRSGSQPDEGEDVEPDVERKSTASKRPYSEEISAEEENHGKRRRRGTAVNYAAPKLNSKLRRGDPNTCSIYKGESLDIYKGDKEKKRGSMNRKRSALSVINAGEEIV